MNSKSILLQYNKDLERLVRFRIVYYAYSNEEGFIGYGASDDDYISKVPYWGNKNGFLEILGAEKHFTMMATTLQQSIALISAHLITIA